MYVGLAFLALSASLGAHPDVLVPIDLGVLDGAFGSFRSAP